MIAISCELQRNTFESEETFIKLWSVSESQREHSNNTFFFQQYLCCMLCLWLVTETTTDIVLNLRCQINVCVDPLCIHVAWAVYQVLSS